MPCIRCWLCANSASTWYPSTAATWLSSHWRGLTAGYTRSLLSSGRALSRCVGQFSVDFWKLPPWFFFALYCLLCLSSARLSSICDTGGGVSHSFNIWRIYQLIPSIFHRVTLISQALIWWSCSWGWQSLCISLSLREVPWLSHLCFMGPHGELVLPKVMSWKAQQCHVVSCKDLTPDSLWAWLWCHLIFMIQNFLQLGCGGAELGKGLCRFDLQGL